VALKGADVFGETPYVAPAPPVVQVAHTDTKPNSDIIARKNDLIESRKKLVTQQQALDDDKRNLAKELAQLNLQQQVHAKALKRSSLGANP
jgi:hypothetical protein